METQEMQKFIQASSEYLRHRVDANAGELQRHLESLTLSTDLSDFNPSSTVATQLFASLHDLMGTLDSKSILIWSAVSVLQKACSNPRTKQTLIHTYKFIPVLARFLITGDANDKQLLLLNVLSELTDGVKISWQEAHLPNLIGKLIQIIMEGNECHRTVALGVLVNLCHKNLPVLYILMRKVDLSKFIKSITTSYDSPAIRMRVCQMLVILEQVKGVLPDSEISNFVGTIFYTISEAYKYKNVILLKQTINLFNDLKEKPHRMAIMARYSKTYDELRRIISLIENETGKEEQDCQSMAIVLEFLPSTIMMNFENNARLFPRLLDVAIKWLEDESTRISAMKVIQCALEVVDSSLLSNEEEGVATKLHKALPLLLQITPSTKEEAAKSRGNLEQTAALFNLLAEMAENSDMRRTILNCVSSTTVQAIFENLYGHQSVEHELLLEPKVTELSIRLLTFVAPLATYNAEWMGLYISLLNKRQVLLSLAISFNTGDKSIKYDILKLTNTPGWSKESLTMLCDIMSNVRSTATAENDASNRESPMSIADSFPMFNFTQESRLNEIIECLHSAKVEGRLTDASTSGVMELYEYKLAALEQSERRVNAALEAADSRCIGLNHQVAQLKSELSRIHQMLFSSQQCIEGVTAEKNDLMDKLKKVSDQMLQESKQFTRQIKEMKNSIKHTEGLMAKKEKELAELTNKTENLAKQHGDLQIKFEESQTRYDELVKVNSNTMDNLQKARNQNSEYEAQIAAFQSEIQELKRSLGESMKKNNQKDQEIAECNKKIQELDRIREIVINVAAGKEKF